MADGDTDPAAVTMVPIAASIWLRRSTALKNRKKFTVKVFRRWKRQFAVNRVVLEQPGVAGVGCACQNGFVRVCRIE